ncbi:SusD/RagB family nutrient-binding outer membrane lipoprotein [Flavivirga spongiicola]|uniref:SusD/RagB family nutrient-binding outer membrane lipoprotein n=1 Tax=Flavivirga spongiicola TaxID=421621 RepID=A0ABU7XNC1_9FLAO|nr:SusD/RagB family nutrient-binding outer membrane lipoprotein [Flavivirga sp. MEBiC05379]MDO5980160.1 SusD/RagB family nutrient-binding outer membrane lipoprotein [Flavivirga sp. MEBiC05379]MDO5981908.1 SusD/RagB family nutrient-binding outer membrane lipoprotein [Flavivirga sp. MEBiC05379]
MKNILKKTFVIVALLFFVFGCGVDMEELNTNPDGITSATPNVLATKLILDITRDDIGRTKGFMQPFMHDKYIAWSEFAQDLQYNNIGRTDFSELTRLIEAKKMVEGLEGFPEGTANSYKALAHFIRAYNYFKLTMKVGDVPYNEALKGEDEGLFTPVYDTQKTVIMGVLDELDMADQLFSNGASFDGDMIYGGDPVKWRKMVNSFQLKVLINLHKKTGDTDVRVVERFNQIVTSRPIFSSNADNFSLVYKNAAGQYYPFNEEGNPHSIYPMVSSELTDRLKNLGDYRLFYYAAPSSVQIGNGYTESDYEAYVGVNPAMEYGQTLDIFSSNDFSAINDRYLELPQGEPVYLLSYAQVQFILAEAAVRGWISNTAETNYENGIKASMSLVAENTPDNATYHHGRIMDATYIDNYYSTTPLVQLGGTTEEQIEQIITQKFLSGYLQSPNTAFFDNRRTGYPDFEVNPVTNLNIPSDKFPVRWMYPTSELESNTANVLAAISSQYSGNDDTNGVMWILQ